MHRAFYSARYKTWSDDDGQEWRLGPLPNRDVALVAFNGIAREKRIGRFSFEETNPVGLRYYLVERDGRSGEEVIIPLHVVE